ncbi:MAG: hypothetical protein ABR600_14230 [Actinomycetota bacterium]
MRVRRIRQHIQEFFRRDWLEGSLAAFGVIVFAVGVFCTFVVIYLIVSFNDDRFFSQAGPTFRKGVTIIGMLLFGCIAGVSLIGSWGLVGKRIARAVTGRRHRD